MPRLLLFLYCALLLFILNDLAPCQASPAATEGDRISLSNDSTWSVRGGSLRWQSLDNQFTKTSLPLDGSVFELVPKEGPVLRSSDFKIVAGPVLRNVSASPDSPKASSSRAADRLPGRELRIVLEDPSAKIQVIWKAILREGTNYVRQEVTIRALHPIELLDRSLRGASLDGEVR